MTITIIVAGTRAAHVECDNESDTSSQRWQHFLPLKITSEDITYQQTMQAAWNCVKMPL